MMYLKPSPKRYLRHESVHALFGSVFVFPASYLVESGWIPNQNAENRPNSCTRYAIKDAIQNKFGVQVSGDFQYMKTCELMHQIGGEVSVDTALQVLPTIGMLSQALEPVGMAQQTEDWIANDGNWPTALDSQTTVFPKAVPISPTVGQDWFDAIRSAMMVGEKSTVIVATRWSPDFETIGSDGMLPANPQNLYWGHCYEVVGWETVQNTLCLIIKSWQGTQYGKGGYCYMPRALCNQLMADWGTRAATIPLQNPANQADIIQVLITLSMNLLYDFVNVAHAVGYTLGMV